MGLYHETLKAAAFAAIVVSGSACYGVVPQWGGGGNHNGGGRLFRPDSTLQHLSVRNSRQRCACSKAMPVNLKRLLPRSGYGNGAVM